jgi:hypothetical protein
MSSLKRMLVVFDVFSPGEPSLTADEIVAIVKVKPIN